MKLIVNLLLLVALIAPGYAQRYCFVCNGCNQPFERDNNLLQRCTTGTARNPTFFIDPPLTPSTEGTPTTEITTTSSVTTETTISPPTTTTTTTVVDTSPTLPGTPEITPSPGPEDNNTTPTTTPSTTPSTSTPVPDNDMDPTLRCFLIERVTNNVRFVDRGCVHWSNTKENTCDRLDGERDTCRICNENECNAGIKIITSFGTILAALLIVLKFY